MKWLFNGILHSVTDRIFRRRFLLSYPKCGRTWLLNVFVNYVWHRDEQIKQPLEFLFNSKNRFGARLKHEGIVFAHGFRLAMNTADMLQSLQNADYQKRRTCLVIRHPARTLYSYYAHTFAREPATDEFMDFMQNDHRGLARLCSYYNYLVPEFIASNSTSIAYYEDLNEKNPEHMKHFSDLFRFYFGNQYNPESMRWAVSTCYFDVLRKRNDERRKYKNPDSMRLPRVREARVQILPDEVLQSVMDELISGFNKHMSPNVFDLFNTRYFRT